MQVCIYAYRQGSLRLADRNAQIQSADPARAFIKEVLKHNHFIQIGASLQFIFKSVKT